MVLSAKDGRGFSVLVRFTSSRASSSSSTAGLLCKGELLDAPLVDILPMLEVRFLATDPWYNNDAEACLLNPGNFDAGAWFWGESCSGRAAMGSRGSLEKALFIAGFGSLGCEYEVGRYDVGRGLGRVFAAVGIELVGFTLVIGGGRFVKFPMPKLEPLFRRSLEAEGRRRVCFPSLPMLSDRFSFEGDGRMAVALGAGRRDIGRGRPLDLPASLLSSMIECLLLVPGRNNSQD